MNFLFTDVWFAIVFTGVVVEYFVLSRFLKQRGKKRLAPALAAFLLSGACLLLAAFALQRGDMIGVAALAMLAGFVAHGVCLWLGWRAINSSG
jgi:protein-S-isoprenylcysteine O-methyltransferase Ste14